MYEQVRTFYELLGKMPGATKEDVVCQYSGGTSLSELYERAPKVYRKMIEDMKRMTKSEGEDERMDRLRKRVIASVAGYFEKAGLYEGTTRRERLQKIIATACRAAGVDDLNDMTEAQMKRVYNEFLRRQKRLAGLKSVRGGKEGNGQGDTEGMPECDSAGVMP